MKLFKYLCAIALTAVTSVAAADDGAITNKNMSRTIQVPTFDQPIVNDAVSEAEHAFTDMMGFYVPGQDASGAPAGGVEPPEIYYCDIDSADSSADCDSASALEVLEVAKPLVNVFIYGPKFHVPETAFGHSFMDTYAAVSLNDGENWKQTNLSESADLSSFDLETDHNPSGPGSGDPLPGDHNIKLGNAFHANGYETPYTAHCTECHGQGLQGVANVPSCYSCHDNRWEEETPVEIGPIIYTAEVPGQAANNRRVVIEGENAGDSVEVTILNAITDAVVGTTEAEDDGEFEFDERFRGEELPPCVVMAQYTDSSGEVLTGPSLTVINKNTGEPIENCEGLPVDLNDYPGGTYNVFNATAGNKTLVAWPSRYCSGGQPAYTMTTDAGLEDEDQQARLAAITNFIQVGDTDNLGVVGLPDFTAPVDGDFEGVDDLYLVDAFGVAGAQGSIDFADEGYPQAGVVPFGCVWTARGVLLPGDDPRTEEEEEDSHMVWTKAERLTSGRRDVNRIEVKAVKGAGFVITWQEDPEGLRPGQGLGPGEGWSGAVAHSQTDMWYTFINEEYFDIVEDTNEEGVSDPELPPIDILDHNLDPDEGGSGRPQVFVPMAVPMRVSNNAKCNPLDTVTAGGGTEDIYCIYDATDVEDVPIGASDFGLKDQCADTVEIETGNPNSPDGTTLTEICVADSDGDGVADLPNRANTGLTRPRLSLQGLDADFDGVTEGAWVIVAAEESKGLGKAFFEPSTDGITAIPCEEDSSDTCTEEIGKNQWYFSFDMGTPDTSAGIGVTDSLVESLVSQGNMLNQGEVYWETGELFGLMNTVDITDYDPYNFDILNTEIARRSSLLVQSVAKAEGSQNRLLALPSWKQGTMRQGGPADTMLRRIVLPTDYDPDPAANAGSPYAFRNMVCETFLIEPGTNPYYPDGVCADPAVNLSGNMPDTCVDDGDGEDVCPTIDCEAGSTYCIGDTNPILQGVVQGEGNQQRVLTWHQCPSEWALVASDEGLDPVACETDENHLDDQSWYNPLDISKGHRGFLDGDFVMFLHAWSPNWRLNAKGNDRYDLYVRRSFDGANTWTTTPSSGLASDGVTAFAGDGTVTCESYRPEETTPTERAEPTACFDFEAGVAEHMRNVTQHRAMRITTLDPRYAATKATIEEGCTDGLFLDPLVIDGIFTCDDLSVDLDSDLRDPSRYFMVFETGDNTTVEAGEAEPLDLFYSRAESFGDDYVVWAETDTDTADLTLCYPNDAHEDEFVIGTVVEDSGFCNEFDNMNTGGDTHASEANLESNPDGSKLYGVWAQWVFDLEDPEEVAESDAMARRIWWIDDYISEEFSWTLPGTQQPTD